MKDFLARQIYLELIHEIFFFFPVSTAWILGYKRIADNFLIGVVRINFLEAVRGEKNTGLFNLSLFNSGSKMS